MWQCGQDIWDPYPNIVVGTHETEILPLWLATLSGNNLDKSDYLSKLLEGSSKNYDD